MPTSISALDELAAFTQRFRNDGKTIVHCHGVFDLLHIGHIRYLQQAATLADVLVVTVTPDRHVNKGPHRPVFTERLRAQAVAALGCVEGVAINQWPTAVETIRLLRPNIYAKGAEYRTLSTPEIVREEDAIRSIGGELVFIEDVIFSSSNLINRHFSPFPDDVAQYLRELSQRYGVTDLVNYLESLGRARALVIGETMVDEYHYCQALGQSATAPLTAMRQMSQEAALSGAAMLANHVAAIADDVYFVSALGSRDARSIWARDNLRDNVETRFVGRDDAPVAARRRYVESYFAQPMFEVHELTNLSLSVDDEDRLYAEIESQIEHHDLVIVLDHGMGMLTERIRALLSGSARFLAVKTEPHPGIVGYHSVANYERMDYACLNEAEIRAIYQSRTEPLPPMLKDCAQRFDARLSIVTRGRGGCLCYEGEDGMYEAPALTTQAADRVGGGPAFFAVTALAAAKRVPLDALAFLGHVAGAEVVSSIGARNSFELGSLRRHIESLMK